jgi:hypothetical protein
MAKKRSTASELKRLGIIPRNWNLRKKLHWTKQRIVDRLAEKHAFELRNAANFTSRKVAPETLRLIEQAGYKTTNGRALIPKFGSAKISIDGKTGTITAIKYNRQGMLVKETTYLAHKAGFRDRLQRLAEDDDGKDEWAFRVGDGNTFIRAHANLASLMAYGSDVQFRDPSASNFVSLVKVEYL